MREYVQEDSELSFPLFPQILHLRRIEYQTLHLQNTLSARTSSALTLERPYILFLYYQLEDDDMKIFKASSDILLEFVQVLGHNPQPK